MPDPVTPPQPPEKPIPSKKWAAFLGIGLIVLFVLLDLISGLHSSAPAQRRNASKQPPGVAAPSDLRSFDEQTKDLTADLEHRRAALQATVDAAANIDLAHLAAPLAECNQAMRDKLNGHYYTTATSQGQVVRLACEENDQWALIPDAAANIQPLTPQQQVAMRSAPQYGSSPGQTRKQEREKAREEALNSSSVALDFSAAKTVAVAAAAPATETEKSVEPAKEDKPKYSWDTYTGSLYRVFEGTVIETVLTNRLAGEFTGPVNVMVTTDLYSHDHLHILMPQGTRILGEALKVSAQQQRRLAVVFHRAIMPDGYSVDFDKFAGLDQQGASGLTGKVDTHWAKVIGTAVLIGAIGGLAQMGSYGAAYGPGSAIETGIGAQSGQQAMQILDRAMNVLPTVTVFEGTRVRIWVEKDAELPAYENHTVNPSL